MSNVRNNQIPSINPDPPCCPQCGGSLVCTGRVVDAGRFKKWLDEWFCVTHGQVQPISGVPKQLAIDRKSSLT